MPDTLRRGEEVDYDAIFDESQFEEFDGDTEAELELFRAMLEDAV